VSLDGFHKEFHDFQLEDVLVVREGRDVMTGVKYRRR
jgi:hypothetical protein